MANQRYIYIDGEKIPVTEEVYRTYKRPIWREHKRQERERENGITPLSLERFAEDGYDIPSSDALVDEIVADKLLLDMLMSALDKLTAEERGLINALYYTDEQTMREYARRNNTNHTNIIRRHNRIIEKLRSILKKYL